MSSRYSTRRSSERKFSFDLGLNRATAMSALFSARRLALQAGRDACSYLYGWKGGEMKHIALAVLAVLVALASMNAGDDWWRAMTHNDRFKASTYKDTPISGDSRSRFVEGIWVPESKDPSKALALPQQVRIDCDNYRTEKRKCVVISVTLVPTPALVEVGDIKTEEYDIDTWNDEGLVASYGGEEGSLDRCQRHVLTMDFASGHVTAADIPTHHGKGCKAFIDTDSYRLVPGHYYVDTSPNNDLDKRGKTGNK